MLPRSMTRRLVAILSADAVGYSRLMAVDEAAALQQLDARRALLREAIEAHRGRVVDAVGDNLLAELPSEVRRALPADVAKRARDEGRAMSVERAFDLALAMLPPA